MHERESNMKKATIKQVSLKIDIKKDFSETLEITRTLFKDKISKTSIVETSLCCASAQAKSFTVTQLATFIIKNLNVDDCFHKKDAIKNDILKSTMSRIRRHVIHTVKYHYKADMLYSYVKESDSVEFTDKYNEFCKSDKLYRKRISALLAKIKLQYKAVKKVTTKKAKKRVKNTVKHVKQSIDMSKLQNLIKAA